MGAHGSERALRGCGGAWNAQEAAPRGLPPGQRFRARARVQSRRSPRAGRRLRPPGASRGGTLARVHPPARRTAPMARASRGARRGKGQRAATTAAAGKGAALRRPPRRPRAAPRGGRGRTCNASLIAMGACAAIAAGGRGTALQARARSVKSKVRLVNEQARASASASYSCMPWCARARATPTPKRPNRAQPVPGACTRTVRVQRPWGSPDIPRAASSARDEGRSHDLTKSRRELERPRRPGAGQGVAMQTAAGALEVPTARRAFTAPRRGPRVPVEAPWRLATPDRSTWPLEVGIKEIKQQ